MTWRVLDMLLDYLGYACFIYAASLVVYTPWRGHRPKHSERWMRFIARLGQARQRVKEKASSAKKKFDGWMLPVPVWHMASFLLLSVIIVFGVTRPPKWPVELNHNVRIISHPSPRQWWIVSDEHPQGFMYHACNDFPSDKWIYAGYFAETARWQVRDDCNSIRDQGFEFDYVWKPNGHAKTNKEMGYEQR